MPEGLVKSTTSFSLSRTIDAPQEAVFNAFADPSVFKQWWGPEGFTTPSAEIDLRPGGAYRIGMKPTEGDVYYLVGRYVEVLRPEKLVYTWAWEEEDGPGHESLVTVEFKSLGPRTEVVVTQERLASAESRDKHTYGWTGCLDKLVLLAPKLKG